MPEIAEVRVVASTLKKQILNKKIKKVKIVYPNIINGPKDDFIKNLEGNSFTGIRTRGKWIIFDLNEYSLLSHLRMEGKYFYVKEDEPLGKHTHVVFTLDNGMDLRYDDVRKFGRMQVVKTSEVESIECISKLGYEPEDPKLTSPYLLENFKNKRLPIKTVLLDQTIINGLGNIYANEVLFAAKIDPKREARTINEKEASNIVQASRSIVKRSTELGGCTIRSYTSSLGVIGHYQDELKVHGREGEPCFVCQKPIERIKIGGRSTYYCPHCQK